LAYKIKLIKKNKLIAEQMLEEVASIMNILSIEYWLEGGTLLGIRRESRLLPWDNDIDISVKSTQSNKLDKLIYALKQNNFRVRVRNFKKSHGVLEKDKTRIIKIRKKRFFNLLKGNVCLEIFVKYDSKDESFWMIGDTIKNVPSKYYKKMKLIEFKGFKYSIPNLTDEYLTYRYGDWKKPIKNWNTFTDDNALN